MSCVGLAAVQFHPLLSIPGTKVRKVVEVFASLCQNDVIRQTTLQHETIHNNNNGTNHTPTTQCRIGWLYTHVLYNKHTVRL